jgi:hypothetical protein
VVGAPAEACRQSPVLVVPQPKGTLMVAKPFNVRKRSAISCVISANNSTRFVASVLRKSATDVHGAPQRITDDDIDHMLQSLARAQERLARAALHIANMKGLAR